MSYQETDCQQSQPLEALKQNDKPYRNLSRAEVAVYYGHVGKANTMAESVFVRLQQRVTWWLSVSVMDFWMPRVAEDSLYHFV